jgi:hypothetical protein
MHELVLHLDNMKREDCFNLKKSWKLLIHKRDKNALQLYSAPCAEHLKKAFLIHLPLAKNGSLSHFPDSDQQIFNAS